MRKSQATRGLTRDERARRYQALRNQAALDEAIAKLGARWVFHPKAEQPAPLDPVAVDLARQRRQMVRREGDVCWYCNGNREYRKGDELVLCPMCREGLAA